MQSASPHGQSSWVADSRFEHEPSVIDKTSEKQELLPGSFGCFCLSAQSHRVVVLCFLFVLI